MSTELPLTGIKAPSLSRYCISEVRYLERWLVPVSMPLSSETKQYQPSGSVDTVRGPVYDPARHGPTWFAPQVVLYWACSFLGREPRLHR